jgi:hypothetical protein
MALIPASNEKLLSALAKYLAEQKFDLKALMREILRSETYQRSSTSLAGNAADARFYSHYYTRRLMAEVMHDAIVQVTEVPTKFEWLAGQGGERRSRRSTEHALHCFQHATRLERLDDKILRTRLNGFDHQRLLAHGAAHQHLRVGIAMGAARS